jgi:hypothetical protein
MVTFILDLRVPVASFTSALGRAIEAGARSSGKGDSACQGESRTQLDKGTFSARVFTQSAAQPAGTRVNSV